MPDDTTETTQPKTPQPASDPVAKLVEEPPHNYDGLSPPGLPSPPGQETPPA